MSKTQRRIQSLETAIGTGVPKSPCIIVSFIEPGTMDTVGLRLVKAGKCMGTGQHFDGLPGESREGLIARARAAMGWTDADD
jgi:hypothetical protein